MKRKISFLLVLATVLSCLMLTVSADDTTVLQKSDEGIFPFNDVKESHWFYQPLSFCYANKIIKGMSEDKVAPNGNLTRAQFLTMLATIDGADLTQYSVTKFQDVKSTHWYYGAVAWAYETELTSGLSETKFGPNQPVTREQIARFMMIYMENKYTIEVSDDCLDSFADINKVSYWAEEGMKYVVSAGLISGMKENGNLCLAPKNKTTRAQMAVIIKSFMENYFYGDCEHSFIEADCTNPTECEICGLITSLPNGHLLSAYDCVTGGKCTVCEAEVEPSKMLHDFAKATCTKPVTCTRCGAVRGEANGHKWNAATCTAPKTCSVCNATEGSALGHTTTTGTCSRCGKVFSVPDYDKILNLLKSKGEYSDGNYMLFTEDSNSVTGIVYEGNYGEIGVTMLREHSNGHSDITTFVVNKNGTVYDYGYYYANTTEYLFAGYGMLDAATFTKSTKEGFSDYEGTLKSVYTDYMNSALKEMLNDVNKILNPYGYSAKQLGFKVY